MPTFLITEICILLNKNMEDFWQVFDLFSLTK